MVGWLMVGWLVDGWLAGLLGGLVGRLDVCFLSDL